MKHLLTRITALLLVSTMLLSFCTIAAGADNGNFLPESDSTFESGKTNWKVFSKGSIDIVDNPDGEGKVMQYTIDEADFEEHNNTWQSFAMDIRPLLQKNMSEEETIGICFDIYCPDNANLPVTIRAKQENFSLAEDQGSEYPRVCSAAVSSEEWIHVEGTVDITEDDLAVKDGEWRLCLDAIPKYTTTVYIDNFFIGLEDDMPTEDDSPKATKAPGKESDNPDGTVPEKTPITRSDYTLIGAVRWDAFTETTPKGTDPASQVARGLSFPEFHYSVPFFGQVDDEGKVSFPKYTEEIWEQEVAYAKEAGYDYFAYLWYESNSAMAEPRKTHINSPKKNDIKMCGILETIRADRTMKELFEAMQEECYVCLDGRPVVFLYDLPKWGADKVTQLREMAAKAGIGKSLYLVGMCGVDKIPTCAAWDVDAYSWYAIGATKPDMPYSEIDASNIKRVEDTAKTVFAFGKQMIPSFSAGYDTRPRIKTAVSWITGDPEAEDPSKRPYGNCYSLFASADELALNTAKVLDLVRANTSVTQPNMVLSYAWNEHDEGGWYCPTLKCDENGNVQYNDDGTPMINTERIEAVKKAITAYRDGGSLIESASPEPAGPNATAVPDDNNKTANGISPLVWIIGGAAVVVVAAVVVTVVVLGKKKKAKEQ